MQNGHITGFYDADNSTLQRFQNGATDDIPTQVGGLAYDQNGNLWMTNSNCAEPISVRMKNGTWHSFSTGSALGSNTLLSDLVIGQNGYKWVVRPRSSGLLVFSDNGTPSDPDDDQAKALSTFEGQGKLPSMGVLSVAEDKQQQIWVGTDKGVAVFYNPDAVFSGSDFDAQQILIEQDGNVQILLETESVTAIAVDGADRKWLGTAASGLFLVSSDGTRQLAHFTAANSPLPSDNVKCLNIDAATGEVFIGTDQGIMGYRGTATEGSVSEDCATVFPNPVRETYTGPVAITGLVRDSDVRITDVAGNVVYHTTSIGGQAIWPVTDMSGNRVSAGVYLVFAMDPAGSSKCNTKIAVVR
jgi:ligand-binding sensor domain-containing protein